MDRRDRSDGRVGTGRGTGRSRRQVLRAATGGMGGIGVALLAACGPERGPQAAGAALSSAPVTIQFFKRGTIAEPDVEVMLADWNRAHPTWKVQLTQGVDQTKLNAYVAADEKIDILGWNLSARSLYQLLGIPRAIDEQVKRDNYSLQRFSAKEIDLIGKYNGKLYALPYAYGGNATAIFYNRSLFQAAGVPEPPADWSKPWTWEQFRDMLRRLTKKTGASTTQIGLTDIGDPVTSLCVLTDAKWISDDYKKAMADTPETIQTFQYWADVMHKDGTIKASPNVELGSGDAFINGKAAMHVICCGPAAYSAKLETSGIDWGFAPQPKIKYASPDIQSNIVLSIKTGQLPEHGWELIKYLIENNRWGNAEKRLPSVLDDAPKWAKETYPDPSRRAQVVADGMRVARPVDKIKYHAANQELNDVVVKPVLADIWAGKVTVPAGLKTLQPQIQAILDRYA